MTAPCDLTHQGLGGRRRRRRNRCGRREGTGLRHRLSLFLPEMRGTPTPGGGEPLATADLDRVAEGARMPDLLLPGLLLVPGTAAWYTLWSDFPNWLGA